MAKELKAEKKTPKLTGKDLRRDYGVFGMSIIQIVGLILILSLVITIAYQVAQP